MPADRWLDSTEGRVWQRYQRATQLLERAVDQELRTAAGLSHPEFEILARLGSAPGHRLRMGVLAALLIAPKSRLSYQVDQLVARGLVLRDAHAVDRRGLDAVLTDDGLALLHRALPHVVAIVRAHLVSRLTDSQLIELGAVMEHVADGLETAPVTAGRD